MNKLKVGIITLALVAAGTASAALLSSYVTSEGTATVEQSVVFGNGDLSKTYIVASTAGNTHVQSYNLKNRSDSDASIEFVTVVKGLDDITGLPIVINDGDGDSNAIVGITVTYEVDRVLTPTAVITALNTHSFDTIIAFDVALDPGQYEITTSVNPI